MNFHYISCCVFILNPEANLFSRRTCICINKLRDSDEKGVSPHMTALQKKILAEYNIIKGFAKEGFIFELSWEQYGKYKQTVDMLVAKNYIGEQHCDNKLFYRKQTTFGYFEEHFRAEIGEPLPKFYELYDQIELLKSEFRYEGGDGLPRFNTIYKSSVFIEWKTRILYELQKLKASQFIGDLSSMLNSFSGWNDEEAFIESVSMLKVIAENYEDFMESQYIAIEKDADLVKEKKIFISHAKLDKPYIELLVELFEFMGLDDTNLFCSSVAGYGIPLNQPMFEFLRDNFNKYDLHVLFVHSTNFYSRPVCLNEMGAAWVAKSKHTSILLPNFDFASMTGVVNGDNASIKLDGDTAEVQHRLDELYEILITDFSLKQKPHARWEQKRNEFIEAINSLGNPINTVDSDVLTLLRTANNSPTQNGIIMKITDLGGTTIQAGSMTLNIRGNSKDTAKWEHTLQQAIKNEYIKQTDSKGKVFSLTHAGYNAFESN